MAVIAPCSRVRRFDQVRRPQRALRQLSRGRRDVMRPVAKHDRGAATVGFLQRGDGGAGGAEVLGGDGVGGGAEHGGHRHLVAGPDLEQIGDRTEKSCATVVLLQPRGAVLAVEADRQRLDASPQRGHLPLRAALASLQFGDAFVGQPQCGDRPVMVVVEADLAGVELADAALHGLELGLHLLRLGRGVLDTDGQPRHRLVDRLDAGAHGVDLPGQPRKTLAAVGFGAGGGQVSAFGLGGDALTFSELRARRLEPRAGFGQLVEQLLFLRGDLLGLGFEHVGVGPTGRLGLGVQMLRALAGDADGGADPFGQRREPEPRLLGVLGTLGLRLLTADSCESSSTVLASSLVVSSSCSRRSVVSAWSVLSNSAFRVTRSSAASRSRASRRSAWMVWARRAISAWRPSGLSWRRSSVVRSVSRARLADIESSLRTAFSLRLRCLSTPAASSMNARRSSGRDSRISDELALADDDVHLAADAGVGEQLLHIHQTATAAVDFVLAAAVAEHPAGDRHLGVLDRQCVVGVVDRDGDLGAAERRPRRRAGEDDVLHLAAAQSLGTLLAHHPGERVDHIGLARPVGADDAGDAWLEAQSRRRSKRLEALQGQTLEVHDVPHYRRAG